MVAGLFDSAFWSATGLFVGGMLLEGFFSWSQPILRKHPTALFWNHGLIVGLIVVLVTSAVQFGPACGIVMLLLGSLAAGTVTSIRAHAVEKHYLESQAR